MNAPFSRQNCRYAGRLSQGVVALLVLTGVGGDRPAVGQDSFDGPPIHYNSAPVNDPVASLQRRLDQGQATLNYDRQRGYLPAVLEQLGVPVASQMLVFSKTSFQLNKISPHRPRAVYFSDDVYVGWVQEGDVVELSAVDPQQGAVFYTLSQEPTTKPQFVRDRGQCIVCHESSRTQGVPGHLVRSVFPKASGHPMLGAGTFNTDHRSPLAERWGGWYVTGTHGKQRHLGNEVIHDKDQPELLDVEHGANVTDLNDRLNVEPYLSPHSDIVALMVLEHQTQMQNRITKANYETRIAMHYDEVMDRALGRPADEQSESTQRRIASVCEELVAYLLFADEHPLSDAIEGTSGFAAQFTARGPRDSQGRSLRDLDLHQRLMKYPCSYVIYSKAFDQLPAAAKEIIYRRLWEVLKGKDTSARFTHLAAADRQAIYEILLATKTGLPDFWQ